MRRLLLFALLLAGTLPAATTLNLHLPKGGANSCSGMSLALGPMIGGTTLAFNSVTNTTAGGTHIQATNTGGGSALCWISEPVNSGATVSGTVTFTAWAKEAAAANNASFEFDVYKYSSGSLGSAFCTGVWGTELTTSVASHAPTCTPSPATAFATGDRVVVKVYIVNCATSGCPTGTMGAGSPGVTLQYDGPTSGSAGNTKLALTEAMTFSAEAAGNMLIGTYTVDDSTGTPPTLTATDENGDACYYGAYRKDTGNTEGHWIFYCPGVTAGSRQINITRSTSSSFSSQMAAECTGVASSNALDSSSGANAASTSISAGTLTLNYTNDLIWQSYWNDYQNPTAVASITPGSQGSISWQMGSADLATGQASEWGAYGSTGSFAPAMSQTCVTAGCGYIANSIGIRAAPSATPQCSYYGQQEEPFNGNYPATDTTTFYTPHPGGAGSGGAPFSTTGIDILTMKTMWFNTGASVPMNTYPRSEMFSCTGGNAIVVDWLGASGSDLTSVTDSLGNTYTSTGTTLCVGGAGGCSHFYVAQNATTSSTMIMTFNGTIVQDSAKVYCLARCNTSACWDSTAGTATATGTQAAQGNLTTSTITPTNTYGTGLVIGAVSVTDNSMVSLTGANQYFTGCLWSNEIIGNQGCDENNGWGFATYTTNSPITFTYTEWNGTTPAGAWVSRINAFNGPSAGGTTNIGIFPIIPQLAIH